MICTILAILAGVLIPALTVIAGILASAVLVTRLGWLEGIITSVGFVALGWVLARA